MNPNIFYGKKATKVSLVRELPDENDDSQLSQSEDEVELPPPASSEVESDDSSAASASLTAQPDPPTASTTSSDKNKRKKRQYTWKAVPNKVTTFRPTPQWKGVIVEADEVRQPIDYFRDFFDNATLDHIVDQSNLFAVQTNVTKPLNIDRKELEQFIGSVIYMPVVALPRSRMYWGRNTRIPQIADVMSRDRWQAIKSNLHLNDNANMPDQADTSRDRLFKIRPLLDLLLPKFNSIQQAQMLSVDEQMIPFKGRSSLRQYIPSKPYKWGYKVFVMCDTNGLVHNFQIYTGVISSVPGRLDIGSSGNIVVKLAEVIKPDTNTILYFDNWFTSLNLINELCKLGIWSLGTIRANRLGGCEFSSDAVLKRRGRGSHEEQEGKVENTKIRIVKWYDNRAVTLASSYSSGRPISSVRRWDKSTKQYIDVDRPHIVADYNRCMGGVDALDALIAYYRIHIRSKKYYHRFLFHFIDMAIVNAWLLYRRDCRDHQVPTKDERDLLGFRVNIAECLSKQGKDLTQRKRGRPSASMETELAAKRHRGQTAPVPAQDVRTDSLGHWPAVSARQRCKRPGCKMQSVVMCTKCNVHLCLNKNQNCFHQFHM